MEYEIEVQSVYPEWWRYNVYLTLVGYNEGGERVDFQTLSECVYEVWDSPGRAPEGWKAGHSAKLSAGPCAWAKAYIYAIPNTMPASGRVADCPDFEATLIARADGREIFRKAYAVNPWGGLSVVGLELKQL